MLKFIKFAILLLAAAGVSAGDGDAVNFRLNNYFSENMVLQRNRPIPVCGRADPGKTVRVSLDGTEKTVKAAPDGKWSCEFPPRPAGGPCELAVRGANREVRLRNIMIGEVWVCSGQSNMAMTMDNVKNAKTEIARANNPNLRLLSIPKWALSGVQEELVGGRWVLCDRNTARSFSAAGYYFGDRLQRELNVPVGLIDASWGGTPLSVWMRPEMLPEDPAELKQIRSRDLRQKEEEDRTIRAAMDLEKNPETLKKLSAVELDDSRWEEKKLPLCWKIGDPEIDGGYFQFRLTVEIPAAWSGKELELNLGRISWADVAYFNGEEVGAHRVLHSCSPDHSFRRYRVPGKLVKPGKNVLSVFVGGWSTGLGFNGGEKMVLRPIGRPAEDISLETVWKFRPTAVIRRPTFVQNMYGSMIAPLFRFPIAGVIWYQGESDSHRPLTYFRKFPEMVRDWRARWGYDFPFYTVQLSWLPAFGPGINMFRDMQRRCVDAVPNSGMAVSIDHGDVNNIHPPEKQPVGDRLAALALRRTYGRPVVSEGPRFAEVAYRDGRAVVRFAPLESPLAAGDGELKGFELAGPDGKFHPAKAEIDGDTVVCRAAAVPEPRGIRYGFTDWRRTPPEANLRNRAGLPASPFTDAALTDPPGK